ncbi:type-F conjugative transfer system secretin TraK [Escherichia coli]|nr:type-F conjugative transfer system secretin TraK [Escherichia coli]
MRKNKTVIISACLLFSGSVLAGNGTLAPTVVPMVNGGQASIAISNTSPNLFTVPGDRIIAVNSLDGALTNNEQTASGGVVVATVNKKPFTFILETERGLNLSIQAVPREGAGRTIQLVSDLRGTGETAGAWETSTPYESLLVAVMFSLIIYIENRMYRTPRNLKKLNVIDEGWRLLDFKNHKVGEFIEKGYRTARRHTGAYITITQNIVDFDSDKASSAARAAWGNSSYKIILKQSAKEFAKYNQLYPDQFLPLQRDMIGKFGAAKDQWFSSFLLQVENHSSWHRLFVDPLSRAMYSSDGPDFEFVQQKRKEGLSIHEAVWQLAWKKSGPEMASLEAWLEEHEKYRSVA